MPRRLLRAAIAGFSAVLAASLTVSAQARGGAPPLTTQDDHAGIRHQPHQREPRHHAGAWRGHRPVVYVKTPAGWRFQSRIHVFPNLRESGQFGPRGLGAQPSAPPHPGR